MQAGSMDYSFESFCKGKNEMVSFNFSKDGKNSIIFAEKDPAEGKTGFRRKNCWRHIHQQVTVQGRGLLLIGGWRMTAESGFGLEQNLF